ncbi:hypothetical protein, partial [Paenibacillus sp. CECT 9249]|uniref:hypothetical protein n=1 Tax=Paenibacillus sp. CECT 9249 TaxID=2845385 RepID=UPI001E56FFC8
LADFEGSIFVETSQNQGFSADRDMLTVRKSVNSKYSTGIQKIRPRKSVIFPWYRIPARRFNATLGQFVLNIPTV